MELKEVLWALAALIVLFPAAIGAVLLRTYDECLSRAFPNSKDAQCPSVFVKSWYSNPKWRVPWQ